jgi:hypothetical protein
LTPAIGEYVTITWEYYQPIGLSNQAVELLSFSFDGKTISAVSGCLPDNLRPEGVAAGQPCMPKDKRSIKFKFLGTTSFCIFAISTSGQIEHPCGTLHTRDLSFTGELRFFELGYPLYDGEIDTSGPLPYTAQVNFDKAYGIYQDPKVAIEDGQIDQLTDESITSELESFFSPDRPYFGSSTDINENQHFGFSLGSQFPVLQPAFFDSPDGKLFASENVDDRHFANYVIFAGVIPFPGTVDKTSNVGIPVINVPIGYIPKPFFVQIDIVTGKGKIYISDTHMGCIPQELVLSTFPGFPYGNGAPNIPEYELSISDGSSSGRIKDARLAFNVITDSGAAFTPLLAGMDLNWDHIPLYLDSNIKSLFANPFVDNEFDNP